MFSMEQQDVYRYPYAQVSDDGDRWDGTNISDIRSKRGVPNCGDISAIASQRFGIGSQEDKLSVIDVE